MVDGHSEVLLDVLIGLELLRVLEGQVEDVVEQLDAVLPVLLQRVGLVQVLEFVVVRGEVLARHYLAQDDLLKLVVFYLDPQVVLALLVQIL